MRPFFMMFKQQNKMISVNMNNVSYMREWYEGQTVMYFAFMVRDEPAYIIVDEGFEAIGKRSDWSQR